jgi:hypothetical protein
MHMRPRSGVIWYKSRAYMISVEWMSEMRPSDITNIVTFKWLRSNFILLPALHQDPFLEGVRRMYTYSQIWRTMTWNALECKHMQSHAGNQALQIINLYSIYLHIDKFLCCFSSRGVVDIRSHLVKNKLMWKRMITMRPLQLIKISHIIKISTLNKKSIYLPPQKTWK